MEKQGLTPNSFYVLTCTTACTVTAVDAWGTTHTLIAPETAGQHVFLSIADKISISDESAIISGPFAKAPVLLGTAGSGGGGASGPVAPADIPADGVLKGGKTYIVTVTDGLDLSALAVEDYAACWLWLDYVSGSVTWPADWSWVDNIAPDGLAAGRYFVRLLSDGVAVIAKLMYSYGNN